MEELDLDLDEHKRTHAKKSPVGRKSRFLDDSPSPEPRLVFKTPEVPKIRPIASPFRPPVVIKKEEKIPSPNKSQHDNELDSKTPEDFLFNCFCKLEKDFKIDSTSELQSIVQNAYSIDPTCQTCGHQSDLAQFDLEANNKWTKGKFSWESKITEINRLIFDHEEFRPNQRRVINAALSEKDCLVVMPTGAGKSLLYQLPAVITEGVTIVVSPLLSLIYDQCTKLVKIGVQANYLTSLQIPSEAEIVMKDLSTKNPQLKLLYVTPERVVRSTNFMAVLQTLYNNKKLSRFVIDEAHCVSQWGHDFRPDYSELDILKNTFPDVPLMALTAAATSAVKSDIMRHLGIVECEFFTQSFNRPSLRYEVRRKTRTSFDKMVKWMESTYPKESGIIYCQQRKDCEQLSQRLKNCEINCGFYHAGMSSEDRKSVQESWSCGEISVLVATCAFGLGIDKPDVRFVIHWNMPSTLETYYQESGRAGRDGKEAHCILFYNYPEKNRIEKKNVKNSLNAYQVRTKRDRLHCMVSYCQEVSTCRRKLLLGYFGEFFDGKCSNGCDNCWNPNIKETDVTEHAKNFLSIVKNLSEQNSRMNYVVDIFRATSNTSVKMNGHDKLPLYGSGKSLSESDTHNMLFELMSRHHVLSEKIVMGSYSNLFTYLKPADNAEDLLAGKIQVVIKTKVEKSVVKNEKDFEDDEEFEVEKIIGKRNFQGRAQYLVKWFNYGEEHNSWVDIQDVFAENLISDFENSVNSPASPYNETSTPRRSKRKTPTSTPQTSSSQKSSKRKKVVDVEQESNSGSDSDYEDVATAVVKAESPYKTPQKKSNTKSEPITESVNSNNNNNDENTQASPFDVFLMSVRFFIGKSNNEANVLYFEAEGAPGGHPTRPPPHPCLYLQE